MKPSQKLVGPPKWRDKAVDEQYMLYGDHVTVSDVQAVPDALAARGRLGLFTFCGQGSPRAGWSYFRDHWLRVVDGCRLSVESGATYVPRENAVSDRAQRKKPNGDKNNHASRRLKSPSWDTDQGIVVRRRSPTLQNTSRTKCPADDSTSKHTGQNWRWFGPQHLAGCRRSFVMRIATRDS